MTSKQKSIIALIFLVIVMTSCRNNREAERAIQTFFVFVIQVVSFVLFGISSLVLSIVGSSSKTSTPRIIGIVLLSIFALITTVCFMLIQDINPNRDYIYFAFVVDVVLIGLSIFFLTKPRKSVSVANGNTGQPEITDEYLDKIIESEAVDEIDELEQI